MTIKNIKIVQAENLAFLRSEPDEKYNLIYIDPPFNTGKKQQRQRIKTIRDEEGTRVGFSGTAYRTESIESPDGFNDSFEDFPEFMKPRLVEALRVLRTDGSLFVHLDYREVHYVKVLLDQIFCRECFMNEIIWAYDYGARTKKRWPAKHDTILWYAVDPDNYTFNYNEIDRIPYMAPGLVGPEKAALGKTPTDVFWQSIVGTNSREKTGYPTQKPLALIERIVKVHSKPGDLLLDFFAGSGTFGEAARKNGRSCVLVDQNPTAIAIMKKRLDQP